ncbi:MAG: aminoacyl-tRNA hydrolase [Clostridiales bacterium]|nr:aminoacyl-tRNA hydrolase [Clostridiales bacterium]
MFGFAKKKKDFGQSFDWLIVGLGNPGLEYEETRHNAGFLAIDELAERQGASVKKLKCKSLYGDCEIAGQKCLLCKPQTFMNNSGEAVRDLAAFYKIPPERTLLLFDDISLEPGRLRIRRKGSDGGHNGIKSILYLTGSDAFPRIKIGVGKKPHPDYDLAKWVLSRFGPEEIEPMKTALQNAAAAAALIVGGETDKAMNRYNR